MIKRFIALAALAAQCFTPLFAAPEQEPEALKYYDVEIIVFKNVKVPKGHEFNLPTPSAQRSDKAVDLLDPVSVEQAAELGFTPLVTEELRLLEIVESLTRSSRYHLLLHAGWRQPGLDEANSFPVWIKGGVIHDGSYSSIDQVVLNLESRSQAAIQEDQTAQAMIQQNEPGIVAENENVEESLQRPVTPPGSLYELEGRITIILSRYLHTHADLVLRKPEKIKDGSIQQGGQGVEAQQEYRDLQGQLLLNYGLNEQRRMRSKKLHYLDHPEFGMLVLITPYEAPEEPVAVDPAASENPQQQPTVPAEQPKPVSPS